MTQNIWRYLVGLLMIVTWGCGTPQFLTLSVYESPDHVVRLQAMDPDEIDHPFSHPASMAEDEMERVLRGLYVEISNATVSMPFFGKSTTTRQRALNESEVEFLAPLLVKGLSQATPEEVVTFYETGEVSSQFRLITSGGVYVRDGYVYVIMSNYRVKKPIWQDNDQYESPLRLRPLDSIDAQPGRLVFESPQLVAPVVSTSLFDSLKGRPWMVGVQYQEVEGGSL